MSRTSVKSRRVSGLPETTRTGFSPASRPAATWRVKFAIA
jgi:hypothetical protein